MRERSTGPRTLHAQVQVGPAVARIGQGEDPTDCAVRRWGLARAWVVVMQSVTYGAADKCGSPGCRVCEFHVLLVEEGLRAFTIILPCFLCLLPLSQSN